MLDKLRAIFAEFRDALVPRRVDLALDFWSDSWEPSFESDLLMRWIQAHLVSLPLRRRSPRTFGRIYRDTFYTSNGSSESKCIVAYSDRPKRGRLAAAHVEVRLRGRSRLCRRGLDSLEDVYNLAKRAESDAHAVWKETYGREFVLMEPIAPLPRDVYMTAYVAQRHYRKSNDDRGPFMLAQAAVDELLHEGRRDLIERHWRRLEHPLSELLKEPA